jgi:DNA polymerase-3 subunit alpha
VVAERKANGPFQSMGDFSKRIDPRLVNKRAYESLVRAGAFDALSPNRKQLVMSADIVLNAAARVSQERETGQVSLFGESPAANDLRLAATEDWPSHEKLSEEFGAVGFYLSGHPLDAYGAALKRLGATTFGAVQEDRRSNFRAVLAGTIIRKQERRGRNDQPYGFVSLSDATGMFECMVFSEVLVASRPVLEAGKSVLITVAADLMDEELKLRALSIVDLDKAAADAGEGLKIYLDNTDPLNAIATQLRQPGKGIVTIVVPGSEGREVEIKLPQRLQVNTAIKSAIKSLPGVAMVEAV